MYTQINRSKRSRIRSVSNTSAQRMEPGQSAKTIVDGRSGSIRQMKMIKGIQGSLIQLKWIDSGRKYLKWDTLISGVRWYYIKSSGMMFFRIRNEDGFKYKRYAGPENARPRETWVKLHGADPLALEDPSVVERLHGKKGLKKKSQVSATPYGSVESAGPEDEVILIRGVHSLRQAQNIARAQSAGGIAADSRSAAPSKKQVYDQVGMDEVAPWAKKTTPFKKSDVVEFTCSLGVAIGYGSRGGGVIFIKIKKKYLSKGDVGAQGWIALKSAPITVVGYQPK